MLEYPYQIALQRKERWQTMEEHEQSDRLAEALEKLSALDEAIETESNHWQTALLDIMNLLKKPA